MGVKMFARLLIVFSLAVGTIPAFAVTQATRDLVTANCRADSEKLCAGVFPGGGRIAECLMAHKDQASPNCMDALLKAKAETGK